MRASIITPTFNSVNYIDACVANVREHADAVLEHIIVDGGSSDGTIDKIIELQKTNAALKYVPGPDKGQSDALNKGVAIAQGDIIGVLNVDDTYQPNTVFRATEILRQMPDPSFVAGDCKIIDQCSIKWNRPKDLRFEALLLGYDYAQWPNNPAAYFYHASAHKVVGQYDVDDHYAMDLDFVFRCARRIPMKYVREHWGNFYLHPGSKTFEDTDGPARQQELFDRFIRSLTDDERSKMRRIKSSKERSMALRRFLKRYSGLRRINDYINSR